jgi:hypothetical protein
MSAIRVRYTGHSGHAIITVGVIGVVCIGSIERQRIRFLHLAHAWRERVDSAERGRHRHMLLEPYITRGIRVTRERLVAEQTRVGTHRTCVKIAHTIDHSVVRLERAQRFV